MRSGSFLCLEQVFKTKRPFTIPVVDDFAQLAYQALD